MALKGTLKDFGIADIFQLIGHQSKTGELILRNDANEVRIRFKDGNVVKAESTNRERKDLLGSMLVRSEVLTAEQLDQALDAQRKTLRRLGDILVEFGFLTQQTLREFMMLQTTETIYKLFLWKDGTYEFEARDDLPDADGMEPIRSESVLMEGFRMVDEWPFIRKKVQSYAMTFRVLKPLPVSSGNPSSPTATAEADFLAGIDDALGEPRPEKSKEDSKVGPNERLVFGLVQPGRDVQKLIDLARMGEFETCKSILNLIDAGYLEGIAAAPSVGSGLAEGGALEPPRVRLIPRGRLQQAIGWVGGAALVVGFVWAFDLDPRSVLRSDRLRGVPMDAARARMGEMNQERLERALEVYRLKNGTYPDALDALVEAGLVQTWELRQPYERPFSYVKEGDHYRLVRPFF